MLAGHGMLEVADEQRVRGAAERCYRVRYDRATIDDTTAAAMTADDHRRGFATVVAVLLAEFGAYLDDAGADPVRDGVGYRQISLWLDEQEKRELVDDVVAAVRKHSANGPSGRRRHLLTPVFFPVQVPQPDGRGGGI